ncbi:hypothetical protein LOK49_LG01G01980 [Camellia lanceoleosa]|uniref:Uncharacterized protein n=1 Tax=Camellia lanceoleosa TaxID=1840588 RepID=A0ACC0IZL5_9ERIC|nr:hypothetical protein LOK49_LG01G01980 [Camellia lanceoleosa]
MKVLLFHKTWRYKRKKKKKNPHHHTKQIGCLHGYFFGFASLAIQGAVGQHRCDVSWNGTLSFAEEARNFSTLKSCLYHVGDISQAVAALLHHCKSIMINNVIIFKSKFT